ncbi:MAG: ABC transporter ATP-binding protein [Anaerolineae bacterium]
MDDTVLEVRGLVKRYDGFTAVDGLTFAVHRGEIFGLLGPNGAGKTTTIRAIMDIFKPDEGTITVLGRPPGEARRRVGYLPEERGLYRDLKVLEVLEYLAALKGLDGSEAQERARQWLDRVDLAEWATRKVKDLSRGMQQKLQFVASVVHDPELLILDEPFQGLDPVNVDLLKRLIRDLQAEGKTILLSAHQMNLVEVLCDRILLIHRGQAVLYGSLAEIKRRYAAQTVRLRGPSTLDDLPGVVRVERQEEDWILTLDRTTLQDLLRVLLERGVPLTAFEVGTMPLEEIFIAVVKEEKAHA